MIAMAVPGITNYPTEPIIVVAWPTLRFSENLAAQARRIIRSAIARAQKTAQ
jgi:hypothetical protein